MMKNAAKPCRKKEAYLSGTIRAMTEVPDVYRKNSTPAPIANLKIRAESRPSALNRTKRLSSSHPVRSPYEAPALDRQPNLSIGRKIMIQDTAHRMISRLEAKPEPDAASTHFRRRSVANRIPTPATNETATSANVCTPR